MVSGKRQSAARSLESIVTVQNLCSISSDRPLERLHKYRFMGHSSTKGTLPRFIAARVVAASDMAPPNDSPKFVIFRSSQGPFQLEAFRCTCLSTLLRHLRPDFSIIHHVSSILMLLIQHKASDAEARAIKPHFPD